MQLSSKVFAFGIGFLVACFGRLDSRSQDQKLPPSETASGPPAATDKIVGEGKVNWTDKVETKVAPLEPEPKGTPVPPNKTPPRDVTDQQNPQPGGPQPPVSQESDPKDGKTGDLLLNPEQVSALVRVLTSNPEVIQMQDGQDLVLLIGGGIELRIPGFRQSREDSTAGKPSGKKEPAKTPAIQRFIDPPELENFKAF